MRKIVLTAGQFAWFLALYETPAVGIQFSIQVFCACSSGHFVKDLSRALHSNLYVLFVQENYQPTVKSDSSLSGCDVVTPGEVVYIF